MLDNGFLAVVLLCVVELLELLPWSGQLGGVVLEHWNIGLQNTWMVGLSSVQSCACVRLCVRECECKRMCAKSCVLRVHVLVCLLAQCQQHFQM